MVEVVVLLVLLEALVAVVKGLIPHPHQQLLSRELQIVVEAVEAVETQPLLARLAVQVL
jgi:hypothetical protein